jgi:hypothetical protein
MKQQNVKPLFVFLFFGLCFSLFSLPIAQGAVPPTQMTFGSDVVEERVDCLITYLKQENKAQIPDDFKTASGLKKVLGQVGVQGLRVEAETSQLALNKATKEILNRLLDQLAKDSPYQQILFAMLENIDKLPEGFCGPEAYDSNRDLLLSGRDLNDDREKYKDPQINPTEPTPPLPTPPTPTPPPVPDNGNFIYYGKKYMLPDAALLAPNGILLLADEPLNFTGSDPGDAQSWVTYPPFIAPLWIISHDGISASSSGDFLKDVAVFESPKVSSIPDSFYRYAYNTGQDAPTAPFSATLYTNPNTESLGRDWILFSYGDVTLPYGQYEAFVGLVPGSGSENHPGPGLARGFAPLDLSNELGSTISGDKYLSIYEIFGGYNVLSNGTERAASVQPDVPTGNFDLADHFLIFRPDGNNKYTVTAGTRDMVVDSLGLDEKETSLDMAIINLRDPGLLARVNSKEFVPGAPVWDNQGSVPDPDANFPGIENWPIIWQLSYKYGIQTVGQNDKWGNPQVFTSFETLNKINKESNGGNLLAYAVQVEEDRVNQKIIDMARDADALKLQVETLKNTLQCGDIRARDALFAQQADAQSGRVTRDHNGNWVRAQQYILRPDNQTVQVLNVALRGQDAGNLAGLSTMDFTTTFKEGYDGDLRYLPWGGWLGTIRSNDGVKQILTTREAPALDNMYVKFTNPSGEYLKESRWFGEKAYCVIHQFVMGEELELSSLTNGQHTYGYHYTEALESPELYPSGKVTLPEGSYSVENIIGAGFNYTFTQDSSINVSFYKVDDSGNGPVEAVALADMWDALRVNESWGSQSIGNNNLEIAIDQDGQFLEKPIDVVYIPMSRMLWKNSPEK